MIANATQDVNGKPPPDAQADDEAADVALLAAIADIVCRADLRANDKCHRMGALLGIEEPVPSSSKEGAARKLAWRVWKKTDGHCTYCREQLNPFDRNALNGFQIDHVNPRAAGGPDDLENLAPACSRCNWSKHARTPEQWGGGK